jgi:hypothetical protein
MMTLLVYGIYGFWIIGPVIITSDMECIQRYLHPLSLGENTHDVGSHKREGSAAHDVEELES